jgi:hypothetical protein
MAFRLSSRDNRRLTRSNQGRTAKQYRERKLARQPVATLVAVQRGGNFVNVTVRGRDIEKMRLRNEAMGDAERGDYANLRRLVLRFKSFSVKNIDTGESVNLIVSPSDLRRTKEQMTKAQRSALDKRYSEDMSEAA